MANNAQNTVGQNRMLDRGFCRLIGYGVNGTIVGPLYASRGTETLQNNIEITNDDIKRNQMQLIMK